MVKPGGATGAAGLAAGAEGSAVSEAPAVVESALAAGCAVTSTVDCGASMLVGASLASAVLRGGSDGCNCDLEETLSVPFGLPHAMIDAASSQAGQRWKRAGVGIVDLLLKAGASPGFPCDQHFTWETSFTTTLHCEWLSL